MSFGFKIKSMKWTLFLFALAFSLNCNAQTQFEIELSRDLNERRMGIWVKGDYKIYVELEKIATNFRWTCQSDERSISYFIDKDSNLVNHFKSNLKRYETAVDQLENAKDGFDLKTLILYSGVEDIKQNVGNSILVENEVRQQVEKGAAIVFYKGVRIYKLKTNYELKENGGLMNRGYEIRTYFDDLENCIFTQYYHLGW